MYDPTLLDKFFTQLEAQLSVAIAAQNFVDTAKYAHALDQLKAWRTAGQTDILPPAVAEMFNPLEQASTPAPRLDATAPGDAAVAAALADLRDELAHDHQIVSQLQQRLATLPSQPDWANMQRNVAGLSVVRQRQERTLRSLWAALLVLVLAGSGLVWWQSRLVDPNGHTAALDEVRTQLSRRIEDVGVLVTGALSGMATPVSVLPAQMTTLAARMDALATRLNGLPGQMALLATRVDAVRTTANVLSTRMVAPTPNLAATDMAMTATVATLRLPVNATGTAQAVLAASLATRAAILAATTTTLAVTPTPPVTTVTSTVTTTADMPTSVSATNTPIATTNTTMTVAAPAANQALTIIFPTSGTSSTWHLGWLR